MSIGPILAVPGIRAALAARRADTVAVSPIVGGRALKGPADHMLAELGHEASVVGVARLYAPLAATLVIDEADAGLAGGGRGRGHGCVVTPTVMTGPAEAAALARPCSAIGRTSAGPLVISPHPGRRECPRSTRATSSPRSSPATPSWPTVTWSWSPRRSCPRPRGGWCRSTPTTRCGHSRLILDESVRVLRRRGELIITETRHGFVCANSGVDLSNVERGWAALLPLDADRSARRIRDGLRARAGVEVGVIVSDTFGRTWRHGLTDVAIGCAGIAAILDLRGTRRRQRPGAPRHRGLHRRRDRGAAELVMGKASAIPVAIVRGVDPEWLRESSVRAEIVRNHTDDLFR